LYFVQFLNCVNILHAPWCVYVYVVVVHCYCIQVCTTIYSVYTLIEHWYNCRLCMYAMCVRRYNCNRYNEDEAKKARDAQEVRGCF